MALATVKFPSPHKCVTEVDKSNQFHGGFQSVDLGSQFEILLPAIPVEEFGSNGFSRWVSGHGFTFVEQIRLPDSDDVIEQVARDIYGDLLAFRSKHPHSRMIRFWNCVPNINRGDGDAEIYKRFCSGRLAGFSGMGISGDAFPAASALGHGSETLIVQMLLTDKPTINWSNPLQINAFKYPRQYGESSPSFARATEVTLSRSQSVLWVSGTASIRGHESIYVSDVRAQTRVALENVEALLKQSGKSFGNVQSMRVYMRFPDDLEVIRAVVEQQITLVSPVFLQADICRRDLLVEIECVAV